MDTQKYAVEEFSNFGFTEEGSPITFEIELGVKNRIIEKNSFVHFYKTITCNRNEEKILNCLISNGILWDMYKLSPNYKGSVFDSTSYSIASLDELSSWIMKQILLDLFKNPHDELYFIIREKDGGPDAIIKRTFVTKLESR
jgi:hypothetical protein